MAVQLEERFQLQLSREEAVQYMQQLIDESVAAVFPQVTVSTLVASRWLAGLCLLPTNPVHRTAGMPAAQPYLQRPLKPHWILSSPQRSLCSGRGTGSERGSISGSPARPPRFAAAGGSRGSRYVLRQVVELFHKWRQYWKA